jgi:hypothetical protein
VFVSLIVENGMAASNGEAMRSLKRTTGWNEFTDKLP